MSDTQKKPPLDEKLDSYGNGLRGGKQIREGGEQIWRGSQPLANAARAGINEGISRTPESIPSVRRDARELLDQLGAHGRNLGQVGLYAATGNISGAARESAEAVISARGVVQESTQLTGHAVSIGRHSGAALPGHLKEGLRNGGKDLTEGASKVFDGSISVVDTSREILGNGKPNQIRTSMEELKKAIPDLREGISPLARGSAAIGGETARGVGKSIVNTPGLVSNLVESTQEFRHFREQAINAGVQFKAGNGRAALAFSASASYAAAGVFRESKEALSCVPDLAKNLKQTMPGALASGWRAGGSDFTRGAARVGDGTLHVLDGTMHAVNGQGHEQNRQILREGKEGLAPLTQGFKEIRSSAPQLALDVAVGVQAGIAKSHGYRQETSAVRRHAQSAGRNFADAKTQVQRGNLSGAIDEASRGVIDVAHSLKAQGKRIAKTPELAKNIAQTLPDQARDSCKAYVAGAKKYADGLLHITDATLHAVRGGEGKQLRNGGTNLIQGGKEYDAGLKQGGTNTVQLAKDTARGLVEAASNVPGARQDASAVQRHVQSAGRNFADAKTQVQRGNLSGAIDEASRGAIDVAHGLKAQGKFVTKAPEIIKNAQKTLPKHTRESGRKLVDNAKQASNGALRMTDGALQMVCGSPDILRNTMRELRESGRELKRGSELFAQASKTLGRHINVGVQEGLAKTPGVMTDMRKTEKHVGAAGKDLMDMRQRLFCGDIRGVARESSSMLQNLSGLKQDAANLASKAPEIWKNLKQTVPGHAQEGLKQSRQQALEGLKQVGNGALRAKNAIDGLAKDVGKAIPGIGKLIPKSSRKSDKSKDKKRSDSQTAPSPKQNQPGAPGSHDQQALEQQRRDQQQHKSPAQDQQKQQHKGPAQDQQKQQQQHKGPAQDQQHKQQHKGPDKPNPQRKGPHQAHVHLATSSRHPKNKDLPKQGQLQKAPVRPNPRPTMPKLPANPRPTMPKLPANPRPTMPKLPANPHPPMPLVPANPQLQQPTLHFTQQKSSATVLTQQKSSLSVSVTQQKGAASLKPKAATQSSKPAALKATGATGKKFTAKKTKTKADLQATYLNVRNSHVQGPNQPVPPCLPPQNRHRGAAR